MFLGLSNKYKWLGINVYLLTCTYIRRKFNTLICQSDESSSRKNFTFNNYTFQTLNNINENFNPNNPNRKIDNKIKEMINEYREAVLFEDYSDLFIFSDEIVSKDEKRINDDHTDFLYNTNVKKKQFNEEYIILDETEANKINNRSFIQLDLNKYKSRNIDTDDELFIDDPQQYFQKLLIYKINDNYYSTSSFCGYDLTDLKTGVLLGNKLICPNCLSEYNIENGFSEAGPNTKHLATFPVGLRKNQIHLKVPDNRIPLFSIGPLADFSNELDPRHFILIGDNETVYACAETLLKTFTGKISIITHKLANNFVDRNKLNKSFFPLKIRHSKFLDKDFLNAFNINYYDEKVISIDGIKRLVNLSSGNKIPFDKVLIAVGSKKAGTDFNNKMKNAFKLTTVEDHAKIHNMIIKPEINSIALIGNSMNIFEIASSLRRYLDAIDKKDTKIYIISPTEKTFMENLGINQKLIKIINDYLSRNNIYIFKSTKELNFEEDEQENVIKKAEISGEKFVFKIPADLFIFDTPNLISNLDFINKIFVKKSLTQDSFKRLYGGIIVPDERMSLHTGDQYAHIFTAGSCSALRLPDGLLCTDNIKTNFHLGYIAALNMHEVHYPYDDVIVNQAKILDKQICVIGNDSQYTQYDSSITHFDEKKEQFIVYLFRKNKLTQVVMYGFERFHIYLREAMRYQIIPNYDFISRHVEDAHLRIIQEMIKNQHIVECFRHKTMSYTNSIDTRKYTVEDQAYAEDITKRSLHAYNLFKEKVDKKYSKAKDDKEKYIENIKADDKFKINKDFK